ncbi:unnamed protein product, partial [Sphacelaria rigidula]
EDVVNRVLRKVVTVSKKKRHKRVYRLAKRIVKRQEESVRALKLRLSAAQFGLDSSVGEGEVATDDANAIPSDEIMGWTESYDKTTGRVVWRNTGTGEISTTRPDGM